MHLLALALAAAPPRPLLPTAHSGVFAGNFRAGTPAMMVHSVRNRQQPFSGWSRSTRQTSTSTTTSQFLEAQKPRSMAAAWIDGGVPRWVTLVDEVLFVVASAAFIKGSLDFFPGVPLQSYIEGINLFFAGSAVYTVLAVFAAYEIVEDAKLSGREAPPAKLVEQALYLLGSVFFLLGTAEFTPPAESSAEDAAVSVSVLGRTFFLGAARAAPERGRRHVHDTSRTRPAGSAASIPEDTLAMGERASPASSPREPRPCSHPPCSHPPCSHTPCSHTLFHTLLTPPASHTAHTPRPSGDPVWPGRALHPRLLPLLGRRVHLGDRRLGREHRRRGLGAAATHLRRRRLALRARRRRLHHRHDPPPPSRGGGALLHG